MYIYTYTYTHTTCLEYFRKLNPSSWPVMLLGYLEGKYGFMVITYYF